MSGINMDQASEIEAISMMLKKPEVPSSRRIPGSGNLLKTWIPASAGMTVLRRRWPFHQPVRGKAHGSCSRKAAIACYMLLATGLSLLSGCATAGKARVETPEPATAAAVKPSPTPQAGPSVVHFTAGREGFVIKEPSIMDEQSHAEFEQADAMIREEKYDKAIGLLEKVITRSPGIAAPHINIAIAYRRINKPEKAEEHLKKALELVPGHPVASNEYGLLLRKEGRFAESRRIYEKSLAAFPEFYPIHRNLGILCDLYLNDPVCALEQYESYSKAMPGDKQVKIWIADLHARSGH